MVGHDLDNSANWGGMTNGVKCSHISLPGQLGEKGPMKGPCVSTMAINPV